MQVVAKLHAKYPNDSETDIAAKLISNYASEEQVATLSQKYATDTSTGKSLNLSA